MGPMSSGGTDWLLPVLVLGAGLFAGLVLALFAARRRSAAARPATAVLGDVVAVRDLRAERDLRIAQLRELDDTASKKTAEALARERWALELDAARVLRELHAAEAALASAPREAQAERRASSAWAGALWGGGAVAFAAILVFVLMGEMGERAPGGSVTGNGPVAPMGGAVEAKPDPELEQLKAFAEQNPQSVDAKLDLAQALIFRDQLVQAFQVVQQVHQLQPEHPRAMTYEAIVRSAMGLKDRAMELLDAAVEKDPALAEAWVHRGLVAFEAAKYRAAVESWEKALALRPDGEAALRPVIAEAKLRLEGGGAAPAAALPAAPGPAHPPASAAAPAAADGVRITVDLDPALRGKVEGGVVFVFARPAGVQAGPPAAVKRLPATGFPIELTLGSADVMMPGTPFPSPARIEARVDSDGNAMTRDPSDPAASADGVTAGAPVRLVLGTGG